MNHPADYENVTTLRQSLKGDEVLSYPQRQKLGKVIKDQFDASSVQIDDVNGDFEVEVQPSVDQAELERVIGKFIAKRLCIHRRCEQIETDR